MPLMQQLSEMYRVSLDRKGLVWEIFELCRDIDAFTTAQCKNTFLAAKARKNNSGIFFSRIGLPCFTADVLY